MSHFFDTISYVICHFFLIFREYGVQQLEREFRLICLTIIALIITLDQPSGNSLGYKHVIIYLVLLLEFRLDTDFFRH